MLVCLCLQPFLCMWPQGTSFSFSSRPNLEISNLEILYKLELNLSLGFQAFVRAER